MEVSLASFLNQLSPATNGTPQSNTFDGLFDLVDYWYSDKLSNWRDIIEFEESLRLKQEEPEPNSITIPQIEGDVTPRDPINTNGSVGDNSNDEKKDEDREDEDDNGKRKSTWSSFE